MRAWTRSLVGRVALASALAAALGGSAAALSTGVTARELVANQEQKTVRAEAKDLAKEVLEELEEDADEYEAALRTTGAPAGLDPLLDMMLAHELDDVKLPGAMAVIRDRTRVLAGTVDLPQPERGECVLASYRARPMRACSVAMQGRTLTLAASAGGEHERSQLIVRALWVGLSLGALFGGLVSYFLSRWSLAPLMLLRDRVRAMPSDDPHVSRLGEVAPQVEVEELRSAIASLVERLGAALKQAQSFAAEAAHELRTPLTTIAGELELVAESSNEQERVALTRVQTQVSSLTELVQRLLVLAQPSRLPVEQAEVVDLTDVTEAAVAVFSPPQRARLRTSVMDDVVVHGDSALLRALLVNALDNALKFSETDVTLSIRSEQGSARIEVIDDGVGIPQAEREQVFSPFYRARSVRAGGTRGHGIGLALIARVAWAHGGEARLLERAVGTHLRVSLPLWNAKSRG